MAQTIDDDSTGIRTDPPEPGIVMVATGREIVCRRFGVPAALGRTITSGSTTIEIADERMSREHATVRRERGTWVIVDRESRNGTYVDGDRISGELRKRGDVVVRLGYTVFVLLEDARGHGNTPPRGEQVIGPELARAYGEIERNANGDTMLLHGESGAGKELAARLYHDRGTRKAGPFVAVNCAAIPEGVAERLLFGAKKGAFSGAIDAFGHFQQAAGGTLFLDEIADLDLAVQAKLLRAIETREVAPVGGSAGPKLDLGVVAASHRELRQAVADKRFRDDLYYRLARVTVRLPALRERKIDLVQLIAREVAAVDKALTVHPKLVELCLTLPWPGNVRELRAALRDAAGKAVAAKRDAVRVEDLADTAGRAVGSSQAATGLERPGRAPQTELDKAAIEAALAEAGGVVSIAARNLGLHRTQLYRLMDRLGIQRVDS